jgi:hypothetical protein
MAMIDSQRHDRKVCAMLAAFFRYLFSAFASLALLFFSSSLQAFDFGPSGTAIRRFPGLLFFSLLACFLSLTPILELCLSLYWASGPFFSLSL